jgi:hypothetical protein
LKMAQAKRTCVVIAGMHRSGTSALARVLNLLGCGLAKEVLGANPTNETGHWEPLEIMKLNDELLESAGSAWDDWTACSPDWFTSPIAGEFKERAARIFAEEHGTQRLTVMKDPRLARLLPFWLESLRASGVDPVVMIPIRNPLEVAQSLHVRDGSDPFYNQLLWLRHVLDAEAGSRGVARHFSTYDQLLDSWTSLISAAENKLGFKFPRRSARASEEVDAYLADRHRHQRLTPKAVLGDAAASDLLKSTYAIMLKWSETGEDPKDYAQLDSVRSELDRSAGTFSRLIYRGKKAVEEVNGLRHALAERDQQAANLRGEFEHISNIANQREHELGALQNRFSGEHARSADLEAQLHAANAALASLTESSAATEAHLRHELEALRAHADAERATSESALHAIEERLQQSQAELSATFDQVSAVQAARQAEQAESDAKLGAGHAEISGLQGQLASAMASHQEQVVGLEAALSQEQAIVKGLTDHVALLLQDIDSAKQAGEAAIQAKSMELVAAQSNLTATTEELNAALAARATKEAEVNQLTSNLAQLESAMRQRGAELDDVNGELKRVMDLLHVERHERIRIDKVVDGLKAHVKLLMEDVDTREVDLAGKMGEIQALRTESERLESQFRDMQGQAKELKGRLASQADGFMQGLINEPHRYFQTKGANLRRKAALLRSAKLLDVEAYLEANPDVAAAAVDPEFHYLTSGFAEGRNVGV